MNEEIRQRMAGMNYAYWHYPFSYFLESMNRLGLEHIEIWCGSPHFYVEEFDPGMRRALKTQLRDHGLHLVALCPEQVNYPVNIAAAEDHVRARSVAYFEQTIQACNDLECDKIVVGPGWGYLNQDKEAAWARSRESLGQLAEVAAGYGVTIALEPLTVISSNLINHAAQLGRMVRELDHPAVKGMVDIGQMSILGETVADYWEALDGELAHVHLVDGNPTGHMAFGDGNLPLCWHYFQLLERGYGGYLTMEINDRPYFLDPEKAFRQSLEMMENWLKR